MQGRIYVVINKVVSDSLCIMRDGYVFESIEEPEISKDEAIEFLRNTALGNKSSYALNKMVPIDETLFF